jgi:hypothetical protein
MAVRNQITEIRTVQEIAGEVMSACQALGLQAEAKSCYNPRLENEGHDLKVRFGGFVKLGLKPRTLQQTLVDSDLPFLIPFKDQVRRELLSNQTLADWRKRDA